MLPWLRRINVHTGTLSMIHAGPFAAFTIPALPPPFSLVLIGSYNPPHLLQQQTNLLRPLMCPSPCLAPLNAESYELIRLMSNKGEIVIQKLLTFEHLSVALHSLCSSHPYPQNLVPALP